MSPPAALPRPYLERLLAELGAIEKHYLELLDASAIEDVNLYRRGSEIVFLGFAPRRWAASDPLGESLRMALLAKIRDWGPRYRLLFPHPIPTVAKRLDGGLEHLERWLARQGGDHSVPPTIAQARDAVTAVVTSLRELPELLPSDEHPVRLAVDTNSLIDRADVAIYTAELGRRYRVHLLPVVLGEIDDLKRSGRTQELREDAKRADRYLKELRRRGDPLVGVTVAGDVTAVFEHSEPRADGLPSWLDLTVPDDRFVAAVLRLQSAHPGSALVVATSDLNLQNKLGAVGLPYVGISASR